LAVRVRVIAVGTRIPAWVRSACEEYLKRLRGALRVTLTEVESGLRSRATAAQAVAKEGERLLKAVRPGDHLIVLDERGRPFSTLELADWLKQRMGRGEDLAFLIGGPDGLSQEIRSRGQLTLSLSRLTLPHALVRVLLLEQLYRAHCILVNHPYHRE
jgi:23S rRNA (pseudouridine1915-N3)-methyltransferase